MDEIQEDSAAIPPVVLLMACQPQRVNLLQRALASVYAQSALPHRAVLVMDGESTPDPILPAGAASPVQIHYLANHFAPGAANTWNVGIRYATQHWPDSYLAILDDDDEWEAEHLATCIATARRHQWPDVVLSGLRMIVDGVEQNCPPIHEVSERHFLVGNPGWHGSNTFIRLATLLRAGAFTPDLASCNDRDLAIRVLALGDIRFAFTRRHTAKWHLDRSRQALSSRNSPEKLAGLARFYCLHGHRMNEDVCRAYFERAETVFGWRKEDILNHAKEYQHADFSAARA